MTSSRSDDVTKSVCVSVCSQFFHLEHSNHSKADVSGVSNVKGNLKSDPRVFQWCSKGVPRMFQGA